MMSIWRQISRNLTTQSPVSIPSFVDPSSRFYSSSSPYLVKVGIPEFLKGIGNGVEAHAQKLEAEFGDLQKLLVVRTLKLKNEPLKIPCKHRKLILKYAHKYRVGLWRPRSDMVKV